jgi:hypothetical protein
VLNGVAQGKVDYPATEGIQEDLPFPVQDNEGLAGILPANFHVMPAQGGANAGAESLGDCFLPRKTRGDKRAGRFMGQTISQFVRAQDAPNETVSMFFAGRFDSVNLDDVNAGAEDQGWFRLV